jgi:hypothetical protein
MKRGWLLVLALLCAACPEGVSPTQVMVVVAADESIAHDTERLVVRVGGKPRDSGAAFETSLEREFKRADGLELPLSITIAPAGGDEKRIYEFVATALDGSGARIGEVRAISGFIKGRSLVLALRLEEACRSISCDNDTLTCRGGDCVDAHVDQAALGSFDPDDSPQHIVDDAVAMLPDDTEADASTPEMDGSMPHHDDGDAGTDAGPEPCEEGQVRDDDGVCVTPPQCTDPADCGPHQLCVDNACQACDPGYKLSGTDCVDVDECTDGVSGCAGSCQDNDGSFTCTATGTTCNNGAVRVASACVDLHCAYYQRLSGPDARVRFIIDRTGSTIENGPNGSRYHEEQQGLLTSLDGTYFAAERVSVDVIPDMGQETICEGSSGVELSEGTVESTRAQAPTLFASFNSDGTGGLHAGLARALQDLTSGGLVVLLFDGSSMGCPSEQPASLIADVNALVAQQVKVLPLGIAGGMSQPELQSFVADLSNAGGTSGYGLVTDDPALMASSIHRGMIAADDCTRSLPEPPSYVGSLEDMKLFAGDQELQAFGFGADGMGHLTITLNGDSCDLVRNDAAQLTEDWYVGYGCTGP